MELLKNLLKTVDIAAVTGKNIFEAINLELNDFEDAVQYITGQSISAEYVITRNPKDFLEGNLKVISPEEFISKIIRK